MANKVLESTLFCNNWSQKDVEMAVLRGDPDSFTSEKSSCRDHGSILDRTPIVSALGAHMTATSLNISGRLVALTLAPRSNSCRVSINLYARRKASWSIRFIKNDTRLPSVTSTYLRKCPQAPMHVAILVPLRNPLKLTNQPTIINNNNNSSETLPKLSPVGVIL